MTEQPFSPGPAPLDPTGFPVTEVAPGTTTGHPRVDAVLGSLADVSDLPPVQQIGPLTQAHHVLRETLDSIGEV